MKERYGEAPRSEQAPMDAILEVEVNPRSSGPPDYPTENRDITDPFERAPEEAPLPKIPPVEEALRGA